MYTPSLCTMQLYRTAQLSSAIPKQANPIIPLLARRFIALILISTELYNLALYYADILRRAELQTYYNLFSNKKKCISLLQSMQDITKTNAKPVKETTLFVSLPSGQSQRVRVANLETATVSSLMNQLPLGLVKRSDELFFVAHGQRLLPNDSLKARGIKAMDTLRVNARLPGGTDKGKGQIGLMETADKNIAAKQGINGFFSSKVENRMEIRQNITDEPCTFQITDQLTKQKFKQKMDEHFNKETNSVRYSFQIEDNDKKNHVLNLPTKKDGLKAEDFLAAFKDALGDGETYHQMLAKKMFPVIVVVEITCPAPPEVLYLSKIDVFNQEATKSILAELSPPYARALQQFQYAKEKKRAPQEQEEEEKQEIVLSHHNTHVWMTTLDRSDSEFMLYQLSLIEMDKILEIMLTMAGEKSEYTMSSLQQCSEQFKRQIMSRLFSQLNPIQFDLENKLDEDIVAAIRSCPELFWILYNRMSSMHYLLLFLKLIDNPTKVKVFQILIKDNPQKLSEFWECVDKPVRMMIYDEINIEEQLMLIFSKKGLLTISQSRRLWDNMGNQRRVKHWCQLGKDDEQSFVLNMTKYQQVTLWVHLFGREQMDLFELIQKSQDIFTPFWKTLSLSSRSTLVEKLAELDKQDNYRDDGQWKGDDYFMTRMVKLLKKLEIKDMASLLDMIDEKTGQKILSTLTPEQRVKFFFFKNFNQEIKTNLTAHDFVSTLHDQFYERNNESIPFAKMEEGYVQCIPNPQVYMGFITVQLVEPSYLTENTKVKKDDNHLEEDFYELETDENQNERADKKVKTDEFRLCENRYGMLQDSKPDIARNSRELGIVSFWTYSAEGGYHCYHSFYIENPHIFKTQSEQGNINKTVLYVGRNQEVFFFHTREQVTMRGMTKEVDHELFLQIIQCSAMNPNKGELSRDVGENCESFRIPEDTNLFELIVEGQFNMMKGADKVSFLNVMPTIIEEMESRYVVFQKASQKDRGPTTYFYDVRNGFEVCRVKGAEAFIDSCMDDLNAKTSTTRAYFFLTNKHLLNMAEPKKEAENDEKGKTKVSNVVDYSWDWSIDLTEDTGSSVVQKMCSRKNDDSRVIGVKIDLFGFSQAASKSILTKPQIIDVVEIRRREQNKLDLGQCIKDNMNWKLTIDTDVGQNGLEKWRWRYMRDAPVVIKPWRRDKLGVIQSFTILAENNFAFTFSMTDTKEAFEEALAKKKAEEQEQAVNAQKLATGKDGGDKAGKGAEPEDAPVATAVVVAIDTKEDYSKKVFQAVYMIPDAQFVFEKFIWLHLEESWHSEEHKKQMEDTNTLLVQSSLREELNVITNSNASQVQFYLNIYDVGKDKLNSFTRTSVPRPAQWEIWTSKESMLSYGKNNYGGKYGKGVINSMTAPVAFDKDLELIGAFLFTSDLIDVKRKRLHFFRIQDANPDEPAVLFPPTQKLAFDYPMMAYKGFAPDNRELVLVNLAEETSPQRLIHLTNLQFICFVGHNYTDRESKIGFLAFAPNHEIRLCWITVNQPFQVKYLDDYTSYHIHEIPIKFELPILDEPTSIQKVEFVSQGHGCEDAYGGLVIQTEYNIYFSNNHTGQFKQLIDKSRMIPLTMLRGFNNLIFYVELGMSDTEQVVRELKVECKSGFWNQTITQIYKLNESKILALELDPENNTTCDSIYTEGRVMKDENVLNRLYVVDDQENLNLLSQTEAGQGSNYTEEYVKNLSELPKIQSELTEYKQIPFSSMSITKRCLTINEVNYNFTNNTCWKLTVRTAAQGKTIMVERDDEEELDSDESEEEKVDDAMEGTIMNYKVHKIINLPRTFKQVILATMQTFNKKDGTYQSQHTVITKGLPGCRRKEILGTKGQRDLESINMISDSLFLMKFRGSEFSGQTDYWTLINNYGMIEPVPKPIQQFLTWSTFSCGASRLTDHGCVLSLKGGQKEVLSLYTDAMIDNKRIISIEFNRGGDISRAKSYNSSDYETSIKKQLFEDLFSGPEQIVKDGKSFDQATAQQCVDTLTFTDNMICSREGKLYRIATIYSNSFDSAATIDPFNKGDDVKQSMIPDKIWAGLYTVQSSLNKEDGNSVLRAEVDDLSIIILLCKRKRDSLSVNTAGFVICGDYLCYQYRDTPVVNVLQLTEFNKDQDIDQDNLDSAYMGPSMSQLASPSTVSQVNQNLGSQTSMSRQSMRLSKLKVEPDVTDDTFTAMRSPLLNSSLIDTKSPLKLNMAAINNDDDFQNVSAYSPVAMMERDLKQSQDGNTPKGVISFGLFIPTNTKTELDHIANNSKILWGSRKTRTINLSVMMDNPENDTKCTLLSDVPSSTQFSVDWFKKDKDGKKTCISKPNDKECKPVLNPNLLQVAIKNQIIVFDLTKEELSEKFYLNATHQFIDPEKYVESGIKMVQNYEDPSKRKDGYLYNTIVSNRDCSSFFLRQDRVLFEDDLATNALKLLKTSPCKAIFRPYCEADVCELKRISDVLKNKKRIDNVDLQTAVSVFRSHTMFTIFENEDKLFDQILTQIQEQEWEEEIQDDESVIQHDVLRRLFRILTLPTPVMAKEAEPTKKQTGVDRNQATSSPTDLDDEIEEQNESGYDKQVVEQADDDSKDEKNEIYGIDSVIQRSLYHESSRVKDCFMAITNRCDECTISVFARNIKDISVLLENVSTSFIELCDDSFTETPFTKKITNTDWYSEATMLTLRKKSSLITELELEQDVRDKFALEYGVGQSELQKQQVVVKMLNIDWMLSDCTNFVDFVRTLKNTSSEQIYQVKLIDVLLKEFWDENFSRIFWQILMPWALFMLTTTWFFMTILVDGYDEDADFNEMLYKYVLSATILGLLGYQLWIEYIESKGESITEYLSNTSNYMDIFTYTMTIIIVTCQLTGFGWPNIMAQRMIAAFVILALWFKVFDWLRLFEKTSFYIRLIAETFGDIGYFAMIFLVCLSTIGCAMYMLQLNQVSDGAAIVEPIFGHFFIDSIYNQYMMSLGEFTIDGFGDHPSMIFCYIIFITGTFVTQLTFLNMLIAIMGDTFGRVIENKAQYGLQTKLGIMGDYTSVINRMKNEQDDENYLFVVRQNDGDGGEEGAAWEGGLGLIKKSVERTMTVLQTNLTKEMSKLQAQGLEAKVRDVSMDKEIRSSYQRLSARFHEIENNANETETNLQKTLDKREGTAQRDIKCLMDSQSKVDVKLEDLLENLRSESEQQKKDLGDAKASQVSEIGQITIMLQGVIEKVDAFSGGPMTAAPTSLAASNGDSSVAAESANLAALNAENHIQMNEKVEKLAQNVTDLGDKFETLMDGIKSLKENQSQTLEEHSAALKNQMEANERRIVEQQEAKEQITSMIGDMGYELKQAMLEQQQQSMEQLQQQQAAQAEAMLEQQQQSLNQLQQQQNAENGSDAEQAQDSDEE